MTTVERYTTAGHSLYDQAVIELDAGDLRQASEKFWGSAAQAMKALAERKGWRHRQHRHFQDILDRLDDRTDHQDLVRWFSGAEALHVNFYEDHSSHETISILAADIRLLIDRLEQVE